jgi:hypothetical protein
MNTTYDQKELDIWSDHIDRHIKVARMNGTLYCPSNDAGVQALMGVYRNRALFLKYVELDKARDMIAAGGKYQLFTKEQLGFTNIPPNMFNKPNKNLPLRIQKEQLKNVQSSVKKLKTFYIMVDVSGKTRQACADRCETVGGEFINPHISLITLEPNHENMISILQSNEFAEVVQLAYDHLRGKTLIHIQNQFELYGNAPTYKFYSKNYYFSGTDPESVKNGKKPSNDAYSIGLFRQDIFDYIKDTLFNMYGVKLELLEMDATEVSYGVDNEVYYRVPLYSFGTTGNYDIPKFSPHLSIFNIGSIKRIRIYILS